MNVLEDEGLPHQDLFDKTERQHSQRLRGIINYHRLHDAANASGETEEKYIKNPVFRPLCLPRFFSI